MPDENKAIADLIGLFRSHMNDSNNQTELMQEMDKKITLLLQAFPENGGVIGHRVWHENRMRECEDNRSTKNTVRAAVMSKWSNAAIFVAILGLWELAKRKLGIL